jgi:iron complex transport system substrate-binding protein
MGHVLAFGLGLALTVHIHAKLAARSAPPPPPLNPQRIVALAPSVTETLYALNLGDRVVGRTRFCVYPAEVLDKPIVGGFNDLNYEAVVRLKPDLAVLPTDRVFNRERLDRLGISTLPLDTRSLTGYLAAVSSLGQKLNRKAEAEAIVLALEKSLLRAQNKSLGRPRPKVLFSVMRGYEGLGYITEINAVGRDGFYDQILLATGADNVYQGPLAFPRLSRESIVFLNPDVIVDVLVDVKDLSSVKGDWASLSAVKAVKNDRILFLTLQADTVPGPRVHDTIDRLSDFFHPDGEAL